jgi:hypothetical protein
MNCAAYFGNAGFGLQVQIADGIPAQAVKDRGVVPLANDFPHLRERSVNRLASYPAEWIAQEADV